MKNKNLLYIILLLSLTFSLIAFYFSMINYFTIDEMYKQRYEQQGNHIEYAPETFIKVTCYDILTNEKISCEKYVGGK